MATEPRQGRIAVDGDRLRIFRERRRAMTREELALKSGLSVSTIVSIENGRSPTVYRKTLRVLAEALGLNLEEATRQFSRAQDWDENIEPYGRIDLQPIPEFELQIAAGGWSDASVLGELNYESQQSIVNQRLFRVTIRGDSMTPDYRDGEVIEFEIVMRDGNGSLEVGRDYAVFNNAGEATFKRLEAVEDDEYVLRPLNKRKYPKAMRVEKALVVAMALAVGKFVRIGSPR